MKQNDEFFTLSEIPPVNDTPVSTGESQLPEEDPVTAKENTPEPESLASAAAPSWFKGQFLGFERWQVGLFAVLFAGGMWWALGDDSSAPAHTAGQFAQVEPLPAAPQAPATLEPSQQQVQLGQQKRIDENRQALTVLSQRLDQDERQLQTLTQQNTTLQSQVQTLLQRPVPVAPSPHTRSVSRRSAASGMHINSLYPGMAWIEAGGETVAVYEGSVVHGVRINRIDATARLIETSAGTLHQE